MAVRSGPGATRSVAKPDVLEDGVFGLEDWLPYEFSFIANRVSSMLASMYQECHKLSVSGWRVLAILNDEAPLSAKQVAARAIMSPVNVSRAVAHLAKLGMVSRSTNAEDYRQVMLSPSKKGRAAYLEVVPLAIAIEREVLQGLNAADLDVLRQIMIRLSQNAASLLSDTRDWRSLIDDRKSNGNPDAVRTPSGKPRKPRTHSHD